MGLRRRVSSKTRWRGIILIEAIKYVTPPSASSRPPSLTSRTNSLHPRAVLRVLILRITRRPLLSPPIPERDFDPAQLPSSASSDAATSPTLAPSSPPSSLPSTPEHLRNNHVPLPPHPLLVPPPPREEPMPVKDYLLSKALSTASVKLPTALMKKLSSPKDWIAELIYVLRPLVYGAYSPSSLILPSILTGWDTMNSDHALTRPNHERPARHRPRARVRAPPAPPRAPSHSVVRALRVRAPR